MALFIFRTALESIPPLTTKTWEHTFSQPSPLPGVISIPISQVRNSSPSEVSNSADKGQSQESTLGLLALSL